MQKRLHGFSQVITLPFRLFGRLFAFPIKGFHRVRHFFQDEPEEQAFGDALANTVQAPSSILEHIAALRKHFIRILIGLLVCVAIVFIFTPNLVDFLAQPIGGISALKAIDVTESGEVFMRVALLGGFAIASPYVAFELWLFAAPGLKPHARILGLSIIPLVLVFFVGGMVFAYFFLLPPALTFFIDLMGIQLTPRPSSYIGFVTGILFWIGITFEFPLIIYLLSLMGIVQPGALLKHWRIAAMTIAILAAAITPTVDPINMILVMGPMLILYFLGVGLGNVALAGRKRSLKETA